MPSVELRNICKHICRDVCLDIFDKEFLVLLGPNGAGKSTLLNVIAGLVDYEGSVFFDGEPVDSLPPSKREIGYLFQDLNLFPHLNVASNVAYSLRIQKWPWDAMEARVEELLHIMKIKHLSSRYPGHLSGGEKQRVALARALALAPQVLLLDEPLSSLDMQSAKYMRMELKQLQRQLGMTTVYVTHDMKEAREMADRIAVIESGRLEQVATPGEVFFSPMNKKVSDFIGAPNILDCTCCHSAGRGIAEVECGGLPIIVPDDGSKVRKIALLPRDIYISESKPPGPDVNRFKGIVSGIEVAPDMVRLEVEVGGNCLSVEMPHYIYQDMHLAVGKEVFLIFKLRNIKIYRGEESKKKNV